MALTFKEIYQGANAVEEISSSDFWGAQRKAEKDDGTTPMQFYAKYCAAKEKMSCPACREVMTSNGDLCEECAEDAYKQDQWATVGYPSQEEYERDK